MYKKYLIGKADNFNPDFFSFVGEDLAIMNNQLENVAPDFKTEIIVTLLKKHVLQNDWIAANPELVQLVTSKSVYSVNIESLFESCQNNPAFRQQLETYLKGKLNAQKI